MGFNMAQASPKTIIQSDYSDVPGVHAIIYIFSMVIREMNWFFFSKIHKRPNKAVIVKKYQLYFCIKIEYNFKVTNGTSVGQRNV